MRVEFNHTIVPATDRFAAAGEVAAVLGLPEPRSFGPFAEVELANGTRLDFMDNDSDFPAMHYAFLVDDESFDAIRTRLTERGQTYWADPFSREPDEINHDDGGRGLYWDTSDGHKLEIITVPYGGA
jgi:hypothetical protein